ncbi:MAG: addiction module protein [bacterium]|nr:addiction module protein [bacterium]
MASLKEIEAAALQLSDEDQLSLVESLLANVQADIDPELKAAWLVEAKRRWTEIESGRVGTVSYDEVLLKIQARDDAKHQV